MWKGGFWEVKNWDSYIPDDIILQEIEMDPTLILYAAQMDGVQLFTHENVKGFFFNIHHKLLPNPFYNTTDKEGMRPLSQKDS